MKEQLRHLTKQERIWTWECYDPNDQLKWIEIFVNTTVDEGLNDILDKYWKGSSYTAQHYVGLTDGSPTFAAGDTMSSHSGWTEVTAYDESNRIDLTAGLGSVSGQSVNNSGNKATFTINSDNTTIGGGFIATDNTKGGSSGILIGGGSFSSDKTIGSGDTLEVTVTISEASG